MRIGHFTPERGVRAGAVLATALGGFALSVGPAVAADARHAPAAALQAPARAAVATRAVVTVPAGGSDPLPAFDAALTGSPTLSGTATPTSDDAATTDSPAATDDPASTGGSDPSASASGSSDGATQGAGDTSGTATSGTDDPGTATSGTDAAAGSVASGPTDAGTATGSSAGGQTGTASAAGAAVSGQLAGSSSGGTGAAGAAPATTAVTDPPVVLKPGTVAQWTSRRLSYAAALSPTAPGPAPDGVGPVVSGQLATAPAAIPSAVGTPRPSVAVLAPVPAVTEQSGEAPVSTTARGSLLAPAAWVATAVLALAAGLVTVRRRRRGELDDDVLLVTSGRAPAAPPAPARSAGAVPRSGGPARPSAGTAGRRDGAPTVPGRTVPGRTVPDEAAAATPPDVAGRPAPAAEARPGVPSPEKGLATLPRVGLPGVRTVSPAASARMSGVTLTHPSDEQADPSEVDAAGPGTD